VFQKTQGAVVRKTNLFLNIIVALSIVMMLLGTTTYAASADDDPPRADPALLQLAAEHPDEIFMIIIQREAKNKELGDENPEQEPKDKE
jgi:hypothetical protein